MALPQPKPTAADFLEWEARQEERHIFFEGEAFAMAGGTAEHNAAAGSVYVTLKQHLKGSPCKAFIGDMRLFVSAVDAYFYPDVVVSCSPADTQDPKLTVLTEALLVVEVLSESTAGFDRGKKFAAYRQMPTLKEYVLIDPDQRSVEVFRKNPLGVWELHPSDSQQPVVHLLSIDWHGTVADLMGE
jgi:Uma2 family endonuclease